MQRVIRVLPKAFDLAHDIAFSFHDALAHYLSYGERHGLFSITVSLDGTGAKNKPRPGEDAFSWLERAQRSDDLGNLLHRVVFAGLLSDACHFLYEALRSSEKGKLTVAFALLRKPLKENLFYLEYLLADPGSFLNAFYNEPIERLNLADIAYRKRAIETIRAAVTKTVHPGIYDPEFLFEVRFDKTAAYGLELYWTRALHLVTTRPPLATEPQNLNFIFANRDDARSQWARFYTLVPFLLHYMCDVCTSLMLHFVHDIPRQWREGIFHRRVGFMLLAEEIRSFRNAVAGANSARKRILTMPLECPRCKRPVVAGRYKLLRLYQFKGVQCPNCRRTFDIASLATA